MRALVSAISFSLVSLISIAQQNTLTDKERSQGWRLLFNGRDLSNWHNFGKKGVGERWKVAAGIMELHTGLQEGGDLITNEIVTGNFELSVDWKVGPSANNGVFLFVTESAPYRTMYESGLEVQIQDNRIYKDEKEDKKHLMGDIFGVLKANKAAGYQLNEWNNYRVVFRFPLLDIFMNNTRIHHIDVTSKEWKTAIAGSFLKNAPIAKRNFTGHIGIQDWHSGISVRNFKIRKLK